MNAIKLCSGFAIIVGTFLLMEGIWGLFSPVIFGVLTTNTTHAIIHILLGVAGLYYGLKRIARYYCLFLGIILLAVGLLRFIHGPDELIIKLINVNEAVAYLNICVGTISLLLGIYASNMSKKVVMQ